MVNNLVLRLHRWIGLTIGGAVVALCVTGAVIFLQSLNSVREQAVLGRPAPPGSEMVAISSALQTAIDAKPDVAPRSLYTRLDDPHNIQVSFLDEAHVFIDPWDGTVIDVIDAESSSNTKWVQFHIDLMLGETGHVVVVVSTIALMVLTLLGLWLWWPNRKTLRRSFLVEFRRGLKRANYDLHNVLGFYTALMLLILSGTGVILAYPQLQAAGISVLERFTGPAAAQERAGAVEIASADAPVVDPGRQPGEDEPVIDRIWATGRDLFPDATWQRVFLNGAPTRHDLRIGTIPGPVPHHRVVFDEGSVTRTILASERPIGTRLNELVGQLHVGTANAAYGVAALLACIIGATLPISGALVWYPRWRRRRRREPAAD